MKTVCVLGLGYIGLPTAVMFARHGFDVLGVDVDRDVVNRLRRGEVHIEEAGLEDLVQSLLANGGLRLGIEPEIADFYVIAVPTPLSKGIDADPHHNSTGSEPRTADLRHVVAAVEAIVPYLRPDATVVLESTVPPRTTSGVVCRILRRSGLVIGEDRSGARRRPLTDALHADRARAYVVHCPERVLPGRILHELVHNDRIIGGVDRTSAEMGRWLYSSFVQGEILLTDATTAEMVKLMENTFRDVNIALANELALVANKVGVDVWEAIDLACRHPRVNILKPGPGVGGHCIAVDPWFLAQVAPDTTNLIQTARRVNDSMPSQVVELVRKALAHSGEQGNKGDSGSQPNPQHEQHDARMQVVACLGLTYKADVNDVRESPAMRIVSLLTAAGFEVRAFDPHVREKLIAQQVGSLEDALSGADLVAVLVSHCEFRDLTVDYFREVGVPRIVDVPNVLDAQEYGPDSNPGVWTLGVAANSRTAGEKRQMLVNVG